MDRYFVPLIVLIVLSVNVKAQNPICPPGIYLADPSARSWDGEKLFLYTSTDSSCDFWCSWEYDILSTKDMENWSVDNKVFQSRGKYDDVSYNEKLLFAPDCAKKDGKYILHYCQPDGMNALGTAISDSPAGPFENGLPLNTGKKYSQIDPSVFIDDDGKAYLVWGQMNMKMAVLKPDLRTIETGTIQDSILTRSEHFFHEGAYMTKNNGLYYLVYADESRENKPTCIGYATSETPFGPYTYRGVIIDNNGCNPGNWNNHGSIYRFKDQWYVFYHRSSHGCEKFRKACVEKISILPDGSIPEVEMTTQGPLPPLNAAEIIDAERACILKGNIRVEKEGVSNEKLCQTVNGDQAVYKYIDFSEVVDFFTIRYKSPVKCKLLLSVSFENRNMSIAEIKLNPTSDDDWSVQKFPIQPVEGIGALKLEIAGEEGFLCEIDWFRFR